MEQRTGNSSAQVHQSCKCVLFLLEELPHDLSEPLDWRRPDDSFGGGCALRDCDWLMFIAAHGFVFSGGQSSGHDEVPRVRPEGPERQPDASLLAESVDVRALCVEAGNLIPQCVSAK